MFNLFKRTSLNRMLFFIIIDSLSVAFSVWVSFLLRFDGRIPSQYFPFIYEIIFLAIIFVIPVFYFKGLYSFSWSYVSTSEAISLLLATSFSFILLGLSIFFSSYFPRFINFPRSTIFTSFILVFLLCGGFRLSKRIALTFIGSKQSKLKERTLIVGAGDAGEQILRSTLNLKSNPYNIIGFVDDNPIKKSVNIHGYKVLGKLSDIPSVVERYGVQQIIIALPSAGNAEIKKAIEAGKEAGIEKIKIAPPLSEIIDGRVTFKNLKSVEIEDLLGREQVVLDEAQIKNFIGNKTILITGAAGSIGSELTRQVARLNPKLICILDQDETGIFNISKELEEDFSSVKFINKIADIRDNEKIGEIFNEVKPNIIFHAAAYKHVPLMENNQDEAIKNNIFGTEILLKESIKNGVEKFVFISTDKAVNPTSIMGATKRVGEMMCQLYNLENKTKFISVRFGNVLNSRGSVIPIFRDQIRKGGPVKVTHPEMKRYFMLTSEACLLVMQAGAMGMGGEVFVLDMGDPIKIVDLARDMIRLSGFEVDKDMAIVFSGIRPGEKLFEEILTSEEGTIATKNKKIFMAKMPVMEAREIEGKINELKNVIDQKDKSKIKEILKQVIPYNNIK